jgi:hypothetical protein
MAHRFWSLFDKRHNLTEAFWKSGMHAFGGWPADADGYQQ